MSDTEKLEKIRNAMADFRKALRDRCCWPIAASKFIESCADLLDADSVAGAVELTSLPKRKVRLPQLGPDSEH